MLYGGPTTRAPRAVERKAVLHLLAPTSRRRFATLLLALAAALAGVVASLTLTGGPAAATPSVSELRAQVQRIQAEVAAIDEQVGMAAEAYNGAVYELGLINTRIRENRAALAKATRNLKMAQGRLGERLRATYMQPPPSRIQLLLSTRSVSAVMAGSEAMERAANTDGQIIRAVRALREQRIAAGKQLRKDRESAKREVAKRAEQKGVVEGLLRRRQAVLSSAKGALARELARERARDEARRRAAARRANEIVRAQQGGSGGSSGESSGGPSGSSVGGSGAPAPTVSGAGSARNAQAARVAMRYLGVPYVWGGGTPSGFDCSGLAMYAYAQVGVSVPHYTGAIWAKFPRVSGPLQPGDMVFFSGLGHMGIYIGGGMMVHAPHTGDVVRVAPMAGRSYVGAVRPV